MRLNGEAAFPRIKLPMNDSVSYKPGSQKKEPEMAKRVKVVRWTKDDLRTLKTMAKDKKGAKKIAKALKRTVFATRAMAVKRGVSLSTRA
jgi:hypothetical protein